MSIVIIMFVIAVASVIVCHMIAKKRGSNPIFWGVMGGVFGPLAIPLIFLSKKRNHN